ncbi:MAG: septum formation initiator family protein [Anaerovoracaceae bacterium]
MAKKSKGRTRKFNSSSDVIDFREARNKRAKKRTTGRVKDKKSKRREERRPKVKREGPLTPRQKKQRARKVLLYLIIALVLVLGIGVSSYKIFKLKAEERQLKAEQIKLKTELSELQREAANKDNKNYIEQQARKQLHLIMPGEILYVLPEENSGDED